MESETLESILKKLYPRMVNSNITSRENLTFEILREMFIHNKNRHLAPESKIFLECSNSSQHIYNIVNKIYNETSMTDREAIEDELNIIYSEMGNSNSSVDLKDTLLHMEERIKSYVLKRSTRIHEHISHTESSISESDNKLDRILTNQESGEVVTKDTEIRDRIQTGIIKELRILNIRIDEHIKSLTSILKDNNATVVGGFIPIMKDEIAGKIEKYIDSKLINKTNEIREEIIKIKNVIKSSDSILRNRNT